MGIYCNYFITTVRQVVPPDKSPKTESGRTRFPPLARTAFAVIVN